MKDGPLFVAKFRNHPLGPDRYTKDFRHNLTIFNSTWWVPANDEQRAAHFEWALNHHQYHYSTDNLQYAELWYCDETDAADREILEKYAPVDFIKVELGVE